MFEDEDEFGLSGIYEVVAELREHSDSMDEVVFPRGVKGSDLGAFSEEQEDLWFAPIELSKEYFDSLTDREVVQYVMSQQMDVH